MYVLQYLCAVKGTFNLFTLSNVWKSQRVNFEVYFLTKEEQPRHYYALLEWRKSFLSHSWVFRFVTDVKKVKEHFFIYYTFKRNFNFSFDPKMLPKIGILKHRNNDQFKCGSSFFWHVLWSFFSPSPFLCKKVIEWMEGAIKKNWTGQW